MDTLISIAVATLVLAVLGFCVFQYQSRRRRPLGELGKSKVQLALRYVPEARAEVERRGTMSRHELAHLLKLNLRRVDSELRRRSATA